MTSPRFWLALGSLALALSCGGEAKQSAPAAASPAQIPPAVDSAKQKDAAPALADTPELRLPRVLLPESNALQIALDPARSSFTGRIDIDARVQEPTRVFWLNAEGLTIERASAAVGAQSWPLEVFTQAKDFAGFRAPAPLAPGPVRISIEYRGSIDDTETEGIFRQKEGNAWYAFTQFEPIAARKAFPCFDEPDSKVPWQVTLEVPEKLVAVSNTAVVSEQRTGRGTKRVVFEKTAALPSYLVAFGVGPFEFVPAGATRSGTPIRVVVPRGRSGDVAWVVESTRPILALLEDYFGTPYPFDKLDLLAIPVTANYGAMENPGLITFESQLLLARPQDYTIEYQRDYALTAAHELAHMWFGDLVTPEWWDDIWLNEAFATWMEQKIIGQWKPHWTAGAGEVERRSEAMYADDLASARRIRQPIESSDDILNAFDGITYEKGSAVLRAFERLAGAEAFREGVRAHLSKHERGNATASDFLDSLSESAKRDVKTPFSTFLDQVGAPLIAFELVCDPGKPPRLLLEQERYRPQGSTADANQIWQIPVCVKYAKGEDVASECTLLAAPRAELELSAAKSCPAWVLPNDGGTGYYRSALRGDGLDRLLEKGLERLSVPERVGVLRDAGALVAAGRLDAAAALALVPRFAADSSRYVVSAVVDLADGVRDAVPDELRPNYARFVRESFGARARRLGWLPAAGDDEDTRILRRQLLRFVGRDGADEAVVAEARRLALGWLDKSVTLDRDLQESVLETAARYGDAALFERLYQRAVQAGDRQDRRRLLRALASFRDPALAKRAISLLGSADFDIRESMSVFYRTLDDVDTRRIAYEAVKSSYDAIESRLPESSAAELVYAGSSQCDSALRGEVESFFKERTSKLPGGPRMYAQAMEEMNLCIARREALGPALAGFLARYAAGASKPAAPADAP